MHMMSERTRRPLAGHPFVWNRNGLQFAQATLPARFVCDHMTRLDDRPESTVRELQGTVAGRYVTVLGTRAQWEELLSDVEYYSGPEAPDCGSWCEGPAVRAAAKRILERVRAIVALFDAEGPAAPVAGPAAPVDAPAAPAEEAEGEWLVEIEEGDELPTTCPQTAPAVRPTVYVNGVLPAGSVDSLVNKARALDRLEVILRGALIDAIEEAKAGQWNAEGLRFYARRVRDCETAPYAPLNRLQTALALDKAADVAAALCAIECPADAERESEYLLRELHIAMARIHSAQASTNYHIRAVEGGR